jgi:hypothetical protein
MRSTCLLLWSFLFLVFKSFAIPKYGEGSLLVNGIQLLQDDQDPKLFYYIPQYPRLAIKPTGEYEILCMKYVGQNGGSENNGGIFHALIEFTLSEDEIVDIEKELKKKVPNAKIAGPVPLMQNMKDENGEEGIASFKLVSSILNTSGNRPLTQSIITSGYAPLLPGSKAALSARLSQEGATLLWNSLQGAASDVSVMISSYYEAKVQGYNAIVSAESSVLYKHFSEIENKQGRFDGDNTKRFTRQQVRNIVDSLVRTQNIKIEVFDRSQGLGIKNDEMEGILNIITNKVTELMFDAKEGWAKAPEEETAIEDKQILGRKEQKMKRPKKDKKYDYVPDNQYVLKNRSDIRLNKLYVNLSKTVTIKVPLIATGNINGIYENLGEDPTYFKTVNLDDPDFQKRDVQLVVDRNFNESFAKIVNYVAVTIKKEYPNNTSETFSRDVVFKGQDLEKGTFFQSIQYPRLGVENADYLNYEYKISWNFTGQDTTIILPTKGWQKSNASVVSLTPPFAKKIIEIDADRSLFKPNYRAATLKLMSVINGRPTVQKNITLKADDAENNKKVALFYDKNEVMAYQVSWYHTNGSVVREEIKQLDSEYLYIVPPAEKK